MKLLKTKICNKCGVEKNLDEFWNTKYEKDGKFKTCIECKRKRQQEIKINVTEKLCKSCNKVKPATEFWGDKDRRDGLNTYCKECLSIKSQNISKVKKNNKEKLKEQKRQQEIKTGKRTCNKCGIEKNISDFYVWKGIPENICKECRKPKIEKYISKTTKVCSKCGIERNIDQFYNDKNKKDGKYSICKNCSKIYDANRIRKPKKQKLVFILGDNEPKICSLCKQEKTGKDFHYSKYARDGKETRCKECVKIKDREKNIKNAERNKINSKIFYQQNKEAIRQNYIKNKKKYKKQRKERRTQPCPYDLYKRISWVEEIRRDQNDNNLLQVKCTYCGRWFNPTILEVRTRDKAIRDGNDNNRLYCSNSCKQECPIYKKSPEQLMREDAIRAGLLEPNDYNREVQPELRQLVFARDNYTCQICGSKENLHCHHYRGIWQDQLESADIDNCVTLCRNCHIYKAHSQPGCTYYDMRRKYC